MKHYRIISLMIIFACRGICGAELGSGLNLYDQPEDFYIVSAILKKSHLTQSEVDKLKLTGFGQYQEGAVALMGGYTVYKTTSQAYELGNKAENLTKGTFIEPYLSEGLLGILSDKRVWALAGALGAGYGSYKVLYTRIERGILEQVKTFVEMCENLDVCNYDYNGTNAYYLSQMGTAETRANGTDYNSGWSGVNAVWTNTSNIARKKGIDNLLLQARVANQLLSQVQDTDDVKQLRRRISAFLPMLTANKALIDNLAAQEIQQRIQSHATQMRGAQQVAQLDLTRQQTSALWYGKISLAATALQNFARNSLQTLVYINDNKEKIISGAVISMAAMYGTFAWIKYKLTGN